MWDWVIAIAFMVGSFFLPILLILWLEEFM